MAFGTNDLVGAGALGLAGGLFNSFNNSNMNDAVNKITDMTKFNPYNVSNGLGSATFNNGMLSMNLSPEYQGVRNNYLTNANSLQNQINGWNTQGASKGYYNALHQMSAFNNQQDRNALENDLAAKGMLGSTGGAVQMRALSDAQNQADLGQQVAGMNYGQGYLQNLYNMYNNNVSGAYSLDNGINSLGTMGGNLGQMQSQAAQLGAQAQYAQAKNASDADSGLFGGLLGGLTKSAGGIGGLGSAIMGLF